MSATVKRILSPILLVKETVLRPASPGDLAPDWE
jgi:hypothetical protein